MLGDDEIDRLARAYVRKHYGPVLPGIERLWERQLVRHFELEDPPGVCFTVRMLREAPRESPSNDFWSDGTLVGDGGFFIYRRTGAIRHFHSGEFLRASAVVAGRADVLLVGGTVDDQHVVHYLLTQSSEEIESRFDALRQGRSEGRW